MTKVGVILVVVLGCLFGIIGFPKFVGGVGIPTSVDQLKANLAHNIRLGLDLKGGSHLVLQVQVQDAAKTEADQTIESLRDATKSAGISVAEYDRSNPETLADTDSIQINLHGVDATKTQVFRNLVADKYPEWILTPVNATDYKMNMKPSALVQLKRDTVTQETDTINRRVDALGLAESTVTPYGASDKESDILVELPGVDDPARVKDLIGTAAQLKIVEVKDQGSWKTREEALAAKGGILPIGTELLDWPAGIGNGSGAWYLVSRTPVITGQDMRNATPGPDSDSPGRWECSFSLSQDGARRFEKFTSSNIGMRLAVVLDNQITNVATIQSAISDQGRITTPIARDPVRRVRMTARLSAGRQASTSYQVLKRFTDLTLLEVKIGTGRTHQIRVHLASIKHPVVGDKLYGAPASDLGRYFLHARQITFTSPSSGERITVAAPLPPELEDYLATLV